MNIFELLQEDHNRVKKLIKDILKKENANQKDWQQLLKTLKKELIQHNRAEEQTFYKFLQDLKETQEIAEHSEEEHKKVEQLLKALEACNPGESEWTDKMNEIKELTTHHIKKEEDEVFTKAKKLMKDTQKKNLGVDFTKLKKELPSS